MDPIFDKVIREPIKEKPPVYNPSNKTITFEGTQKSTYVDFDGETHSHIEEYKETADLNGIKDVKVTRKDSNTSKSYFCCFNQWKIVYELYLINSKNEKRLTKSEESWQFDRNEDRSIKYEKNYKSQYNIISLNKDLKSIK